MKVAFIVPRDHDQHGPLSEFTQCKIFPPVSLARMAGQAAQHAHVSYLDERADSASDLPQADIAVVFVNSYNRYRAYEIARAYQDKGCFTVFTGPFLSQAPEEACRYAKCVFIGGGEEILPGFLVDYRCGKPRRLYASANMCQSTGSAPAMSGALTLSLA